jgi:hypothetical protein
MDFIGAIMENQPAKPVFGTSKMNHRKERGATDKTKRLCASRHSEGLKAARREVKQDQAIIGIVRINLPYPLDHPDSLRSLIQRLGRQARQTKHRQNYPDHHQQSQRVPLRPG